MIIIIIIGFIYIYVSITNDSNCAEVAEVTVLNQHLEVCL
jgi:hypothetical protein